MIPMIRYLTSVLAWFAISGACFAQTTWTLRNSNSGDLLYDVTFGGDTFVAVGTTTASGSSVTSPDGIVWTHHVSAVGGIFYSVAHGNNRFVAVGSNSASSTSAVSTDGGRTWAGGPVGIGLEFRGVAWTGDGFIAVGGTGGNAVIATSPDGASWTGGAVGVASTLKGVVQGGTTRVAVGTTGVILYSLNGGEWRRVAATPNVDWEDVAFNAGRFLVIGVGGQIMTSTDGITWVLVNSGSGDLLYGIATLSSPQIWVATGSNGRILVSNNAQDWTTVLPAVTGDFLYGAAAGVPAGSTFLRFVAVGTNGRILSSDGPEVDGPTPAAFVDDRLTFPGMGGAFTAPITAGPSVSWNATTGAGWITLSNPRSGTGNGQISGFVQQNLTAEARTGTISIGTDTLVMEQAGVALLPPGFLNGSFEDSVNAIQLSWAGVFAAQRFEIERRNVPEEAFTLVFSVANDGPRTVTDSDVTLGQDYEYRIRSVSGAIRSEWSSVLQVSAPPEIPGGFAATARNASQIELTWSDVRGELGYLIFRASGEEMFLNQIARLPPDEVRYLDSGLDPSETYHYEIEAESRVFGRRSPTVTATTPAESRTIVWGPATLNTVNYTGIAHGNGITVAVGNGGLATRSTDGLTWTDGITPTEETLNAIDFAEGRFVAVGNAGTLITSIDGLNWTAAASPATESLSGVAFLVQWYAAGVNGALLSSLDGLVWSPLVSPAIGGFVDLFAGDVLVAMEDSGRFLTSADGLAWTETRAGTPPDETLPFFWTRTAGAFGNGVYSVVGPNGHTSTSADAATWGEFRGGGFLYLDAVAHGGGRFVAVSRNGRTGYSTDGRNYLAGRDQSAGLQAVTYAHDRFVAAGQRGLIVTSPNGVDWTEVQKARTPATHLSLIAIGGGRQVAYGMNENINGVRTPVILRNAADGNGWTEHPVSVEGVAETPAFHELVHLEGRFLLAGDNAAILTSTDGTGFATRHVLPGFLHLNAVRSVAMHDGVLLAGGDLEAGLLRSEDGGLTWNPVPDLPPAFSADRLRHASRWVGGAGEFYSEDGGMWSQAHVNGVGPRPQIGALGRLGDEPLLVDLGSTFGGSDASASISWDGRNWNRRPFQSPSPPNQLLNAVAYGAGVFVASGGDRDEGARLWASLDGVRWETAPGGILPAAFFEHGGVADLAFHESDRAFYGVGRNGLILRLTVASSDFAGAGPDTSIGIERREDGIHLTWHGDPAYTYLLRHSESLSPPSWTPVGSAVVGTGSSMSRLVPVSPSVPGGFWSLLIEED
ncbi:MAG: hypothetical protein KF833_05465 [Verrucomicrobiae bacterium]|nr:hypothetical protein [Verrucomicrobiae bacterium]